MNPKSIVLRPWGWQFLLLAMGGRFPRLVVGIGWLLMLGVGSAQDPPAEGFPRTRALFNPAAAIAGQMFSEGDRDANGRLSAAEFNQLAADWFEQLDLDGVGILSREEFLRQFDALMPPPPVFRTGSFTALAGGFSRYLGFFTAVDSDADGSVSREEWLRTCRDWHRAWAPTGEGVTKEQLTSGLASVMPRTNMSGTETRNSAERLPGLPASPPAPALAPGEALKTIQVADGFRVELAATEPMIEEPTAISFDPDGRMFVIELRNYMLDLNRTGEREPVSRISLLTDADGDGRFDQATVFLDQLVAPRSLAAMRGGLLYVDDGKLLFARDTNGDGRADVNVLVDERYGGGNVEHAPNGLLPAMDNWIYNARSRFRYRWVGDTLLKQETESRGQWGITQDNYGRLLYNVNNSQLLGDYAPPNQMGRNPHHPSSGGLNLFVATDQRTFARSMNTAVNRGYSPDVLDSQGRAFVFASSCGPVVYRGDQFPAEFVGNAFVCDPALNLIKRNLVSEDNLTLTSRFAYEDREFLAATDERFRPVNAFNGPDGALWVVDMYRGVIQYGLFMTPYLRRETEERGLDQGIHLGRIYRVVSTGQPPARPVKLSAATGAELVGHLAHPNGWVRDVAQQLLVTRGDRSVVPALLGTVSAGMDQLARIHALWTLEGLLVSAPPPADSAGSAGAVRLLELERSAVLSATAVPPEVFDVCQDAVGDSDPKVQVAAIRVLQSLSAGNASREASLLRRLTELPPGVCDEVRFFAALAAAGLPKPAALPFLARLATEGAGELLIREAILSGLEGWELQFTQMLLTDSRWQTRGRGRAALLQAVASAVIRERDANKVDLLLLLAANEQGDRVWRQRSVLSGIAAMSRDRNLKLVGFDREPRALAQLAQAGDSHVSNQVAQVRSVFAWPGHQMDQFEKQNAEARVLVKSEQSAFTEGKTLYQQICAGCHGMDGEGLTPLAPPLAGSDWVVGSDERLIRIVLHGLSGPVEVSGVLYQPPAVSVDGMPPLALLPDEQLATVLTYIRRSWDNAAGPITAEHVAAVRAATQSQQTQWNQAQLLKIK